MSNNTQSAETTLELPQAAPQVRVTAGVGSAGQKTWNLRRPVTLLGSKRPAHIILHDRGISMAHCAIVNTGTDVLLFDLHTGSGTFRGQDLVDLVALQDGDVIKIGETTIQVAIRQPVNEAEDSSAGLDYVEPTLLRNPVTLSLMHTETDWKLEHAVTLIGRQEKAGVRLDHAEVSNRHALFFRFGGGAGVFDLGSRSGTWVNGQRCEISVILDSDRITIGPFGLQVKMGGTKGPASVLRPAKTASAVLPGKPTTLPPTVPKGASGGSSIGALAAKVFTRSKSASAPAKGVPVAATAAPAPAKTTRSAKTATAPSLTAPTPMPPAPEVPQPAVEPSNASIAEAWERLNQWRAQLRSDAAVLDEQQSTLSAREAELRGRLQEIARLNENLDVRERQLAERAAGIQEDADKLGSARKELTEKETELTRLQEELNRREQALAQRWSRMQSTTCPHCRKPVTIGHGG